MKINFKKFFIKTITMVAIAFVVLFFVSVSAVEDSNGRYQYLNSIDYNVSINDDGSARIVETWDIYVKNTNTLFKSFNKSERFGEITNVTVRDVNRNITMKDYGKWVYHAPVDYFYAANEENYEDSANFEIGWGVRNGKLFWK